LFYLNLPCALVAGVVLAVMLNIERAAVPFTQKIKSMDWVGAVLISGSLTALLYAIVIGGTVSPWVSASVLGPLVGGITGFVAFGLHETFVVGNYIVADALIPPRIFSNRTATVGYFIIFAHGLVVFLIGWGYPMYVSLRLSGLPDTKAYTLP
jgi:hypothetical protein